MGHTVYLKYNDNWHKGENNTARAEISGYKCSSRSILALMYQNEFFFFHKCKLCVIENTSHNWTILNFCTNYNSNFQPKLLKKTGQGQGISENTDWLTDETHKATSHFDAKLIDKTQPKEWTYLKKALHVLEDVDPTVAEVCLLGDLSGGAPPNLLLQIEWSLLLSVPFNLQIPVTQKYIKNLTTVY